MKKLALVLVTLSLVLGACDNKPAKPVEPVVVLPDVIKIGTIQPMSGPIAIYGQQTVNAVKIAIEEINAAGGILGKPVELIVEDDENKPEKTTNAFTKMVSQDKVVGIVGALTSNATLSIAPLAQSEGVPLISPTATNDKVTLEGDFIFRACYTDSFQGSVVGQFAVQNLKAKKAAVFYDVANDYSTGLYNTFKSKFEALNGVGSVSAEAYSAGDKDFSAQITKLKTLNPDVIFIPDYYSTVTLIATQFRSQGITVPLLGADGWDSITAEGTDDVIGSYYSNHYSPEADDAEVKKFVASYVAKHGEVPNALAALGYDATYILAKAIENAKSVEPKAIRDAMAKVSGKFVTGNISFDANRNPIKSAVMVEIIKGADGKLATKYAGTVNP